MHHHVRLGAVGIVLVLAASLLSAAPASAAKAKVSVGLSAPSVVDRGKSARLTGTVTSEGKRLVRVPVRIMRQDGKSWKRVATVRTSSKGGYKHVVSLTRGTRYRAEVLASARRARGVSTSRAVKVRPVLAGISPRGSSYGVRLVAKHVTGKIGGNLKGRKVELQEKLRGKSWKRVASTRSASGGRFSLEYVPKRSGVVSLRVSVPAASGLTRRDSVARTLVIKGSVSALMSEKPGCLGAAAMANRCSNARLAGLVLPTRDKASLRAETGGSYAEGCWTRQKHALLPRCTYGKKDAKLKIALTGDSHAASYLPGLRDVVARSGWRMDTYLGTGCRWNNYPTGDKCRPRVVALQKQLLAGKYDAVVYTGFRMGRGTPKAEADALAERHADLWKAVAATGTKVIGLADFAHLNDTYFGCLFRGTGARALDCSIPSSYAYGGPDPIPTAVTLTPGAKLIDLKPFYCPGSQCKLVVGNVTVYRDNHHLSGTFSKTIGPYLFGQVRKIVTG